VILFVPCKIDSNHWVWYSADFLLFLSLKIGACQIWISYNPGSVSESQIWIRIPDPDQNPRSGSESQILLALKINSNIKIFCHIKHIFSDI
jgi:hypothetical protein